MFRFRIARQAMPNDCERLHKAGEACQLGFAGRSLPPTTNLKIPWRCCQNETLLLTLISAPKHAGGLVALASVALTAGSASADVIVTFQELADEAGIHATGSINGVGQFDVMKPNSETFHVSSPVVPSGYTPDAILSHIGVSQQNGGI